MDIVGDSSYTLGLRLTMSQEDIRTSDYGASLPQGDEVVGTCQQPVTLKQESQLLNNYEQLLLKLGKLRNDLEDNAQQLRKERENYKSCTLRILALKGMIDRLQSLKDVQESVIGRFTFLRGSQKAVIDRLQSLKEGQKAVIDLLKSLKEEQKEVIDQLELLEEAQKDVIDQLELLEKGQKVVVDKLELLEKGQKAVKDQLELGQKAVKDKLELGQKVVVDKLELLEQWQKEATDQLELIEQGQKMVKDWLESLEQMPIIVKGQLKFLKEKWINSQDSQEDLHKKLLKALRENKLIDVKGKQETLNESLKILQDKRQKLLKEKGIYKEKWVILHKSKNEEYMSEYHQKIIFLDIDLFFVVKELKEIELKYITCLLEYVEYFLREFEIYKNLILIKLRIFHHLFQKMIVCL